MYSWRLAGWQYNPSSMALPTMVRDRSIPVICASTEVALTHNSVTMIMFCRPVWIHRLNHLLNSHPYSVSIEEAETMIRRRKGTKECARPATPPCSFQCWRPSRANADFIGLKPYAWIDVDRRRQKHKRGPTTSTARMYNAMDSACTLPRE